jgi:hypothetical protein
MRNKDSAFDESQRLKLSLAKTNVSAHSVLQSNSELESSPWIDSWRVNKAKNKTIVGWSDRSNYKAQKLETDLKDSEYSDKSKLTAWTSSKTTDMTSPQDTEKKLTVNDFEFLGVIGEGSFGKVHHVVSKTDGSEYALKSINKKESAGNKYVSF